MTLKTQKIVSAFFISAASILSFQALVYMVNLNQIVLFLKTAFWVWLYLGAMILLFFDLHFKAPGALALARKKHEAIPHRLLREFRVICSALNHRFGHYFRIIEVKTFFVYFLLPGFLFWSTVAMIYVNLGRRGIQELYAWISTAAMVAIFWYLKETFHRRKERVDSDIFVVFSVAKIYTLTLAYGAGLTLFRSYCLEPKFYALAAFAFSFLLMYQALYQHGFLKVKHLAAALGISLFMGILAHAVYIFWGYNYFSAAIFMAAFYNFFWGIYHYHLDHGLNRKVFMEILLICFTVALVVFANTNFKEQISNSCF